MKTRYVYSRPADPAPRFVHGIILALVFVSGGVVGRGTGDAFPSETNRQREARAFVRGKIAMGLWYLDQLDTPATDTEPPASPEMTFRSPTPGLRPSAATRHSSLVIRH
jgi:hypothetical protein